MITRKQYLFRPAILHHAYFMQFANRGILASVALYFTNEELRASIDEHFNDISPDRWDSCSRYISTWIDRDKLKEAGDFYSPSFGVCLSKAVARHLISR